MKEDPLELKNLINEKEYKCILDNSISRLKELKLKTGDNVRKSMRKGKKLRR